MKKILLAFMAGALTFGLNAQVRINGDNPITTKPIEVSDAVVQSAQNGKIIEQPRANKNHNSSEVLGTTYYDLQTNSTVQDRIVMNSNGDISAAWTASEENSTTFSDRGTGYSHYDPNTSAWTLSPDYPRIESDRCGWATLLYDGNGGELIVAHSTASNVLKLNKRASIGTGSWTEKNVSSTQITWSRSAMGGTDGNTLHIIGATDTSDWASNQNMYRAIVYYRSQDAGSTFDKVDVILPGIDSASCGQSKTNSSKNALSIDAYAIAAKGNVVAFAIFNRFNDIILMKSTNNGDTWTKTIVNDFPYDNYYEMDNFCDSAHRHITSDESGAIVIDNNNVVHLTWGRATVRNNETVDDGFYYLTPFTDSLGYWNENMGANNPSTCGFFIDKNNNGIIDVGSVGEYYQGAWLSYPNMSVGTDNSIWAVYSGLSEDTVWASDFTTGMRHIYLVRSKDGGMTWSDPYDLTREEPDLSESVYPDMVDMTDDHLRLIYQHDWHPSVYVPTIGGATSNYTQQTQATLNDIVYLEVDTSLTVGIEKVISGVGETGVFPNPSQGQVDLTIRVYKDVDVQVYVTNLSGQIVHTYQNSTLKVGKNQIHLDLSSLTSGMYFVNILAGESLMTEKLILK
jgi:hypothetical protein